MCDFILNQLLTTERLAAVVSSRNLEDLELWTRRNLRIDQSYSDFFVGSIAWRAQIKFPDIIAAPLIIVILFFAARFLMLQLVKQKWQFGSADSTKLLDQLIWWSLPAIAAIFGLILGTGVDHNLLYLSAAGIGFIAISTSYNSFNRINICPEVLGRSALAIILIGLMPLELALVLGRAPTTSVGDINLDHYVLATRIIIGFGLISGLLNAMRRPEQLTHILPKLLLVGQIGLPTLFLTIYPARLLQANGAVSKYQTTWGLKLLVVGMIVWGVFDVVRRYLKYGKNASGDSEQLFSRIALFALLVALTVGNTISPSISSDDYHFGESLVGWWSYLQGTIPYVGYLPAHGLIDDDLTGLLSHLFYDGSAGSISDAGRLSFTLLALVGFFSIYRFSGSIVLAFVSIFFIRNAVALGGEKWIFFIPFLCLWFSRSLISNPARWLSVWILTVPIVILGVPPQGLLLVAASSAMAVHMAWILWKTSKPRQWKEIWFAFGLLFVFAMFTPLLPMLVGAIRYVAENGAINQVAYGIPWRLSWRPGINSGLVFEVIRMSWLVVPTTCLYTIVSVMKDSVDARETAAIRAIVILLFSLLLIPYSMGRIDPHSLSRPGIYSIFGWTVLLPVALWGLLKPNIRAAFILLIVGMSSTLSVVPLFPLQNLISSTSALIGTGALRSGQVAGMPNIGIATVEDEHWNGLVKLNALLSNKLSSGETYLDLTGRQAQYFYLNRKPSMAVTAPYNMVPIQQQQRAVNELTRDLPRIALLQSNTYNIDHDGGGLALRNPYLYRFVIDNYIPSFEDGFIIGEKKSKVPEVQNRTIDVAVKDFTDANWDRGVNRGQAAVIAADPAALSFISIGDQVRAGIGELRRVVKVSMEEKSVWFEGPLLKGDHPIYIHLPISAERLLEYRASLFQQAFSTSDLQKIPVAWGRSYSSLRKKMTLIKGVSEVPTSFSQLIPENGGYKVNGTDPILNFDILSLDLSGRDAGLLKFDFSCINRNAGPRIQVFWWGDDRDGPFEASSVRITAVDGTLIIPLDSDPRWLTLKRIKGIRIDLDNASACSAFSIRNIGLFQRIFH